ncbi:MAG: hypothetical protein GX640_19105 [Fibrobacter sp.]|nr:hypothetical protein [Fibrobacter sp.]
MRYISNKPLILVLSFLCFLITVFIDYLTEYEFRVFVIYFLLVFFVTLKLGRNWGIVFLLLSDTAGFVISVLFPNPQIPPEIKYWDAVVRFIVLVIIVGAVSQLKESFEREKVLRLQLENRANELADANRDLRSLTYSIVHDLKNPLIVISGFTDFLKESDPEFDSSQKDALTRIISETRKMQDTIDDLLRMARIGTQTMKFTDVDLSIMAESVVGELKQVYPDITYNVNIFPKMKVYGDAGLLRLLLTNLIGNAMKFSSKTPTPQISIGVTGSAQKNGGETYFVKDNGAGFDQKNAEKIFEPFVRLHTPREFPGTGVGLAIVRRILEKHNGTIWVSSEPGKGTTFYFTFNNKKNKVQNEW